MIANEMRVAAGQLWELPSEGMADPIQLRVMEVADDGYAAVQTVRRSAPDVALHRSTMHVREVMDTGVLVDGPGALDPRVRRERAQHLSDLLVYAARQSGSRTPKDEFRFDGHEVVQLVASDEGVPSQEARAMLWQPSEVPKSPTHTILPRSHTWFQAPLLIEAKTPTDVARS